MSWLRILAYHRVIDAADATVDYPGVVSTSPSTFLAHMRWLAGRYRVIGADEAMDAARNGRALPKRAVLITFDDAYRDFGEIAWPILRKLRLPATVFVPTSFPDQPTAAFWWDRLHRAFAQTRSTMLENTPLGTLSLAGPAAKQASLKRLAAAIKCTPHDRALRLVDELCVALGERGCSPSRVLGWAELRELARDGVTVAPHTQTHPALDQLPLDRAREEIRGSRERIRIEIGTAPPLFAYPFGRHDEAVLRLLREEGFQAAVSTLAGHNRTPCRDPLLLRRTNVNRRTAGWALPLRLLQAGAMIDRFRTRAGASA